MRLRDPGAQPERTSLAWSRTTLSLIAVGLLCVRVAPSTAAAAVAAAAVCGGAALMLRRNRIGFHARRRLPAGGAADPVSVLIATGLTILLAVVAVLFTF